MKKSILALGALAVVGGLGLAGSAQAVVALSVAGVTATTATGLQLNVGSTGHELIVPYYSVQSGNATMFTIVNTDWTNGKAVKVRFRGAANSDDVLDFTVLMSPGDVWTAGITQGTDGLAHLSSTDKSCTIPSNTLFSDVPFITERFPSYMSASDQATNTREGYIEILNMANIPPKVATSATNTALVNNALYAAIKHVNGVPPCAATWTTGLNAGGEAISALLDTNEESGTALNADYGLDAPTGGLQGGWMIVNQSNMAQYSGNDTAVLAVVDPAANPVASAVTDVMFSPQLPEVYTNTAAVAGLVTADPLLTGSQYGDSVPTPLVSTMFYDLPDLSTPMASSLGQAAPLGTPTDQAFTLAGALGHVAIDNEFINDPNGAAPMSTDWILSQATRRYFAVVNYSDSPAHSTIVYNDAAISDGTVTGGPGVNALTLPYAGKTNTAYFNRNNTYPGAGNLQLMQGHQFGPQACLVGSKVAPLTDREETQGVQGPAFSPSTTPGTPALCGEVATLTWGNSPLGATLTNTSITTAYKAGWGTMTLNKGAGAEVPVTGYAALIGGNTQTGFSLGATWGHRW
jgi:hypothetical protein